MDETCRLRRGEGYEACEDEPPEAQLRSRNKEGTSVNPEKASHILRMRSLPRLRRAIMPSGHNKPRVLRARKALRILRMRLFYALRAQKGVTPRGVTKSPPCGGLDFYILFQLSTTSRISIGQAFAQMPQAMHFDAGSSGSWTRTPNGHASLHLPHWTQSFLLII